MSSRTRFCRNAILSFATAATIFVLAVPGGAQSFKPTPGPQPGQCKAALEWATSKTRVAARDRWSKLVATKHGNQWSVWAVAANKTFVPIKTQKGDTWWQARARPCYMPAIP